MSESFVGREELVKKVSCCDGFSMCAFVRCVLEARSCTHALEAMSLQRTQGWLFSWRPCDSVLVQAMSTINIKAWGGAVYGEDGTGKAALLAHAAVQLAQQEREARIEAERCHLHCCAITMGMIANPAAVAVQRKKATAKVAEVILYLHCRHRHKATTRTPTSTTTTR